MAPHRLSTLANNLDRPFIQAKVDSELITFIDNRVKIHFYCWETRTNNLSTGEKPGLG